MLQLIKTGSILKLHLLLEKFILDQEPELDYFHIFMVDYTEENADHKDMNTLEPKSLDGDYNNSKNKKLSKKTRKEML